MTDSDPPIQSAMPKPGLTPLELAQDLVARIERGNAYARSRKSRFRSSSTARPGGKGIATQALVLLLEVVTARPLYARAASDNAAAAYASTSVWPGGSSTSVGSLLSSDCSASVPLLARLARRVKRCVLNFSISSNERSALKCTIGLTADPKSRNGVSPSSKSIHLTDRCPQPVLSRLSRSLTAIISLFAALLSISSPRRRPSSSIALSSARTCSAC